MNQHRRRPVFQSFSRFSSLLLCGACWATFAALSSAAAPFDVRLDPATVKEPVTGRLYVYMTQNPKKQEPRSGEGWFDSAPFFGLDVKDARPDAMIRIDDSADGFPNPLSKIPPGTYRVQALLAHNREWAEQGFAPGNFYSAVATVDVSAGEQPAVSLSIDRVAPERKFPDRPWIKPVAINSCLLSQYLHYNAHEYAAVVLPAGYDEHPNRHYPVIYDITGFGGYLVSQMERFYSKKAPTPGPGETDFIVVQLDGQCEWGHHCYADSATNGPRGQALVSELIPEIDRRFRTIPAARGRFLMGHSSGGWASLWLQVTYPDVFGGVWSTSPDPVDFRDFQLLDLYANPPQNMYTDAAGHRVPMARDGTKILSYNDTFTHLDDVLKRGGQMRSFEAVFSPLDAAGEPKYLWNRQTGRIDPEVAQAWRKYDIRLKLLDNWKTLGPKLRGKLHIAVGDRDTFYLNGAVVKLAETLKQLGSDAQITIVPGADHAHVRTPEFMHRAKREMTAMLEAR